MSVIPAGAAADVEVIIHTFGAMGVDILSLLAFLPWREHFFWILSLSLVLRDDKRVGGWQVVRVVGLIYKIVH